MRKEIEKYELIERFLNGDLNNSELDDFKLLLSSDPLFSEEIVQHGKLHHIIDDCSFVDLKDRIKEIHINHKQKKSNWSGKNFNFIFIGIITVSAIILYIVFNRPAQMNPVESINVDLVNSYVDTTSLVLEKESDIKPNNKEYIGSISIKHEKKLQPRAKFLPDSFETPLEDPKIEQPVALSFTNTEVEIPSDSSKPATVEENSPIIENKCKDITISANIITEKSCDNKPTGHIIISQESVTGGTAPYTFSIDEVNFDQKNIFENLFSRVYSVSVQDRNGCKSNLGNIIVDSKDCSYEFVFAPDHNEVWEIPTFDKTGDIKIYNKFGVLVYQQVFDYSGVYAWSGISGSGSSLPMGIYMFILNLENESPLIGNVSIVR